jgi:hypothetical protein
MNALPGSKACLSPLAQQWIASSGLHHGLTLKRASKMGNDEAIVILARRSLLASANL